MSKITPENPVISISDQPSTSTATLRDTDQIVDRWFSVTFPGSIAVHSTEVWNFLMTAKEELKKLLR